MQLFEALLGTLSNHEHGAATNLTILGHGTLSGDRLPHPHYSDLPDTEYWRHSPISISGTHSTRVEGITIANSAYHSLMLQTGSYNPEKLAEVRWVKIFTWRANGDGINPFKGTLVEDCFIRTQDDSTYVDGAGIRRVVYWQDGNGSTFVLSPMGKEDLNTHPLVVEDCTVVYARLVQDWMMLGLTYDVPGLASLPLGHAACRSIGPSFCVWKQLGVDFQTQHAKRGANQACQVCWPQLSKRGTILPV